jgi:hypothetical protein
MLANEERGRRNDRARNRTACVQQIDFNVVMGHQISGQDSIERAIRSRVITWCEEQVHIFTQHPAELKGFNIHIFARGVAGGIE